MRSATPILLAVSMMVASACSTGVTPPEPTPMASITNNLTFEFGADFDADGFCVDPRTPTNQQPSCSSSNGVQLPLVWPSVTVELQPFAIDVHEVTNIQYQYCVAAGACSEPRAGNAVSEDQQLYYDVDRFEQYPVVNVTWEQARDYCAFIAEETGTPVRLPTEAEWERVAKGPNASPRLFPTDAITSAITECQQAGFNGQYCRGDQRMDAVTETTVDYVDEGSTRIYQLFGNAAEWVATPFQEDVSCAGEAPCTREDECSAGDAQCITDAKSCSACTAGDNCYYLCEGEAKKTILCKAYSSPVSGADFEDSAEGVDRVYRGGHVAIVGAANSYALCQFRSSRSNAKPNPSWSPTASQPWLGFRCAKSL
ncbi:MAG: hypothetical protein EP329_13940 [Deltaproteobacteria bacterium]|nr:MAG: hypothetical protein EP329_13940 [Deltaproteobacteria bacterium]